jgi:acetyl-CoA carboxylase carboxyl transferase subunit beta
MEEQPAAGPPRPAGDRPTDAGWSQVLVARTADRPPGWQLIAALVDQPVELGGADRAVRAVLGRSAGSRTVAVALCAHRGSWPGPGGFAQLARAARLADAAAAQLVVLVDTPGANSSAGSEAAGIAPAIATAMRAVLECRSPTLCLVHGEGGSGGALAGAVTDRVLVTPHSYFSALGPEGAGVALHMSAAEAADAMGLGPAQLLRLGFAQAMAPTEPGPLRAAVADQLAQLAGEATEERLARRRARWGSRLPGRAGDGPARSGLPIG